MTGDPWRPADESGAAPAPQGSYGDGAPWDADRQQAYPQPYQQQEYPRQQAAWTAAPEPVEPRPWNAAASGYPAEPAEQQPWNVPASGYPGDPQPTQIVPPAPGVGDYGQSQWPGAPYAADQQPTQVAASWPGAGYDQQPTQLAYQAPQTQTQPPQAAPPQPQQPVQQPSSRLAQNWGTPAPSAFSQPAAPAQPAAAGYQPTSVIPPLPGRYDDEYENAYPQEGGGRGPAGSEKLPRFVREHPTEVGLGAAVVVASLLIVGVLSLGGNGDSPVAAQAASTRAATQGAESSSTPSGQAVVVPADTPGSPSPSPSPSATTAAMLAPGATGQLVNAASGLCLTTSDPSFGQGSTIVLAACGQAPTQEWTDTSASQLTQNNNAGCLDDFGQGTAAGTEVDLWTCNGGTNQQWTLLPDGTIVGRSSNLCVSPVADGGAAGTQVVLEACDGSAAQRWT